MPKKKPTEAEIINSLRVGQVQDVFYYLERGQLSLNQFFSTRHYPLYYVVAHASNEYLLRNLLLEQEIDVNIQDDIGMTPLMWAATFSNKIALHLLIDRGADPDKRNNQKEKALDLIQSSEPFLRENTKELFASRRPTFLLCDTPIQNKQKAQSHTLFTIKGGQEKLFYRGYLFFKQARNFIAYRFSNIIQANEEKETQNLIMKKNQ